MIKYFGLELIFLLKISVFKFSGFFGLKKSNFLTFFLAGIKIKWAGIKKKLAGIKHFGLELIFFYCKSVFLSFFFLQKSNFFIYFWLELEKEWAGIKKMGWNKFFLLKISFFKFFGFFCLKKTII